MLDWLVIGGGPHGVHSAARLVGEAGVAREAVGILDDEAVLLARWKRFTQNTGMRYLRSPAVHHLDLSSSSLQSFVRGGGGRRLTRPFTRPYYRPSLDVFDRHSKEVIEKFGLEALHSRGRAHSIEISDKSVRVGLEKEVEGGGASEIEARQVILAVGAPRQPVWPRWARRAVGSANDLGEEPAIQHIFDPGFNLDDKTEADGVVAVVGAGISGVQLAVRLAKAGSRVVLLSRHALRIHPVSYTHLTLPTIYSV